jgi:cytochrome c553
LTAGEIATLADYLAEQAPRAADPKLLATAAAATGKARAEALGCAACHGQAYQGQDNYARLAGQGYEYLTIQLTAFRDGDRIDPAGVMSGLAAGLSDEDIDSLSRYFSAL